jgi:2-dehydropantoate 2-reductase
MRIGVVGAGVLVATSVGVAYAGTDVAMVARGDHLRALRHRGLQVRHVDGDFTVRVEASADPSEIGRCDIVLLCVKSYDTIEAVELLRPLIGDESAVVSLQNGIDNEQKISDLLRPDHVMGGAAFIFAHIAAPGVVEQTGGPRRILFGELDGSRTTRANLFLDELHRADIDAEIVDNIESVLWDKYAFLCALAGVTAAARLPINDLLEVPESRELFGSIVGEVAMVASAEGVELADDIVDQKTAFATTLEPDLSRRFTTTSAPDTDSNSTLSTANCSNASTAIISTSCLQGRLRTPQTMGTRQPAVGDANPNSSPGEPRPERENASSAVPVSPIRVAYLMTRLVSTSFADVRRAVNLAEDAGLDGLGVGDHVSFHGGAGADGLVGATRSSVRVSDSTPWSCVPAVVASSVLVARQSRCFGAAPGRLVLGSGSVARTVMRSRYVASTEDQGSADGRVAGNPARAT